MSTPFRQQLDAGMKGRKESGDIFETESVLRKDCAGFGGKENAESVVNFTGLSKVFLQAVQMVQAIDLAAAAWEHQ